MGMLMTIPYSVEEQTNCRDAEDDSGLFVRGGETVRMLQPILDFSL